MNHPDVPGDMNASQSSQDRALRPLSFDEFRGQTRVKRNLETAVKAAKSRGDCVDHVLLCGPPGLGKTTLSAILAHEMGSRIVVINAPTIKRKGELAAVLTSLRKGDILFLDEIHGLNPKIEEILYPAMEDLKLEIVAGNMPLTLRIEPFTLVGATTRAGMLQRPLRDRFGIIAEMQPYDVEELADIVKSSAKKMGLACFDMAAEEIARRSQGTPRIANRLLRRVRDHVQCADSDTARRSDVTATCDDLGIDEIGLDQTARKYLAVLARAGKPVSFKALASLLGESRDVIEQIVEPHLLRTGLVEVTPRGRQITQTGFNHVEGR